MREDPAVLKKALGELQRLQREKQLEKEAKTDPKKKLVLMMLKAARKKQQRKD